MKKIDKILVEDYTEEDEEFLQCINDLSEPEKNCIIAYMTNKIKSAREETAREICNTLREQIREEINNPYTIKLNVQLGIVVNWIKDIEKEFIKSKQGERR